MLKYHGAAMPLSNEGLQRCAEQIAVRPVECWTVLTVETRGCGFLDDRRPAILFERHIFHRRTQGRYPISNFNNSAPGGHIGFGAEYERLASAWALDQTAALESASWGIGQVMGFHAQSLGYQSVQDFVGKMFDSEESQLVAFCAFILRNDMAAALRKHRWAAFARVYNGSSYKKNQYDTKLAAAYDRLSRALPDLAVREAQILLNFVGINAGRPDGFRGKRTTAAVVQFQSEHNLPASGCLDEATLSALRKQARTPAIDANPWIAPAAPVSGGRTA